MAPPASRIPAEIVVEVERWLDEHWDPDLTVQEWWRRLADEGLSHPQLEPPYGSGYDRAQAAAVMTALRNAGGGEPPPGCCCVPTRCWNAVCGAFAGGPGHEMDEAEDGALKVASPVARGAGTTSSAGAGIALRATPGGGAKRTPRASRGRTPSGRPTKWSTRKQRMVIDEPAKKSLSDHFGLEVVLEYRHLVSDGEAPSS